MPELRVHKPADSKFCFECGARLSLVCGQCGAELPPSVKFSVKFCNRCGKPAAETRSRPSAPEPRSYTPRHLAQKILIRAGAALFPTLPTPPHQSALLSPFNGSSRGPSSRLGCCRPISSFFLRRVFLDSSPTRVATTTRSRANFTLRMPSFRGGPGNDFGVEARWWSGPGRKVGVGRNRVVERGRTLAMGIESGESVVGTAWERRVVGSGEHGRDQMGGVRRWKGGR